MALAELKAEYFYCVDNKLWEQLVTLFTPDATFRGTGFRAEGPHDFVDKTAAVFEQVHSSHYGFQPTFSLVEGDGSLVQGRWAMQDFLTWDPQYASLPGITVDGAYAFHGFGYYEDTYRLDVSRWKISSMRLIRTRFDVVTSGVKIRSFQPHREQQSTSFE